MSCCRRAATRVMLPARCCPRQGWAAQLGGVNRRRDRSREAAEGKGEEVDWFQLDDAVIVVA